MNLARFFSGINPLFFQDPYVGEQKKQHAHQPGKGLGDGSTYISPEGNKNEGCKDFDDKLHGAGDQRDRFVIDSLKGHPDDQQDAKGEEKDHIDMKVHHGITHDHRIIGSGESPYQRICQSQDHDQEKERPDQADHRGFLNAFPDPVDAAGTEILADKGGVGTGNAGQRHVSDHDDPAGSRVGGNDGGSKCIDGTLQDDRTDGKDRIHQSHGKTGGNEVTDQSFIIGKMSSGRDQKTEIPIQVQKTKNAGNQLRHDSGTCNAGYSEMENRYGQKIQKKVQTAGKNQKVQRRLAVSDSSEKAGAHVVEKSRSHPAHDDGEVGS